MNTVNNELKLKFDADIPNAFANNYETLKRKIDTAFPSYRVEIIESELLKIKEDQFENIKYKAVLSVLKDLINQGYTISIENGEIYLKIFQDDAENKDFVRSNLLYEKKIQLEYDSVNAFIKKMEKPKEYNGTSISILNLIGDVHTILERINGNDKQIVSPYIQIATNEIDKYTGYSLKDIWKYFRFTWSIPYKNTPGRNTYYLVRDSSQKYHPIIGIFALGNCVLNLTVRDNIIGWNLESIKRNLSRKCVVTECQCNVNKSSITYNKKNINFLETEREHITRIKEYAIKLIDVLQKSINNSIEEIYKGDLADIDFNNLKYEYIEQLKIKANKLKDKLLNTPHLDEKKVNFLRDATTPLYSKKRYTELSKLIESKLIFEKYKSTDYVKWLKDLTKSYDGQKAINTAIIANRKTKIGSNMMEIIVCGSIPPYNELLGGKLVSMLACSPQVISDYNIKYKKQISEIASRMSGRKIIRDNSLVFLGTTSLYTKCSSQYNRVSVISENSTLLNYQKVGITEGFGSFYFSKTTTELIQKILFMTDGGRKINNVFGEGTSPRFRLLTTGFSQLGIKPVFLKHTSPRIVYMMPLTNNCFDYLMGMSDDKDYYFDVNDIKEVRKWTNYYTEYWYNRWLKMRIQNKDVIMKLVKFKANNVLVSNNK